MMVHRGEPRPSCIDFFVAAPGLDGVERGAELVAGPGPLRRRDRADVLRRAGLLRRAGDRGRPGAGAAALRLDAARRAGRAGDPARSRGGAGQRRAGLHPRHPRADPRPPGRARASSTRPAGARCARATTFRFPELAEALERFAAEGAEPFYRGEVAASAERVRRRAAAARSAPADLAAYEAIERRPIRTGFRGAEVLTNPPPSSGGHPDRLLPRPAGAAGREQRPRAAGRRDGRRQRGPRRGVRRGALRRGAGGGAARPGRARPRGRRPARLDHPHLRARRRRHVRQRHLLQRLRLRRAGPRHRGDPQQHARRGGPQPARLPRDRARAGGCPR